MRTVKYVLHRWQGDSGRNPFLWIEVPEIFDLQCRFYFCCSAFVTLDVEGYWVSNVLSWKCSVIKTYCVCSVKFRVPSVSEWKWTGLTEVIFRVSTKTCKDAQKSVTQKCHENFFNNAQLEMRGQEAFFMKVRRCRRGTDIAFYLGRAHISSAPVDLSLRTSETHSLLSPPKCNYSYRENVIMILHKMNKIWSQLIKWFWKCCI